MLDKLKLVDAIKEIYATGGNIISYLRGIEGRESNTLEDIMISYDFQAGTYNVAYREHPETYHEIQNAYAEIINSYISGEGYSLCEAGVGEGTTFLPLLQRLITKPQRAYAFDISWSRIFEALSFSKEFADIVGVHKEFVVGDIFETPFANDSIDIVYTSHSLEPNGGKERELLGELFRITSKYLILFEPIYEFASDEGKKRMDHHGYIKGLKRHAEELGYSVIRYEKLSVCSNPLNPTGVLVIQKEGLDSQTENGLRDPISKKELREYDDCYFCEESMLSYPKIRGIPCLTKQNAVLTTKFNV